MPAEITMPQLSDTMTEGKLVKWIKNEGDKVAAGDEVAEIETDKATMPMEAFDDGVLAYLAAGEGEAVPVGGVVGVIAVKGEEPADIKKQYQENAGKPKADKPTKEEDPAEYAPTSVATPAVSKPVSDKSASKSQPTPGKKTVYKYDLIVIGGGPAGYAAAIRAGQLGKRVLCIEKENLGGTCLNWGCIPTKAMLEDSAFIRQVREESEHRGMKLQGVEFDFSTIIKRSRDIANKLAGGIGHLFHKHQVKHEMGHGKLLGPHRVQLTPNEGEPKEFTAEHVMIAVGASPVQLPGMEFDGKTIITSREAMTLKELPESMAIIGAGAIGAEFADVYSSLGVKVTLVELADHLLPNEDNDVSIMIERIFKRRGMDIRTKTKCDKAEKLPNGGIKLHLTGEKAGEVQADILLVAVGVRGNTDNLAAPEAGLKIERNRVIVDPEFRTNLENVWALGDCCTIEFPEDSQYNGVRHPDLAHVAHHEAVYCVERIFGFSDHSIDYIHIPACTYTHPQVASMGKTEKKLREEGRNIRVGKFPFSASGRALAAGESDGFVKLIFDKQYGELLGAHMIGENVTEMLSELVLARKLEATEAEILQAIHPHPTMSEAIMEAAGVSVDRAIHL